MNRPGGGSGAGATGRAVGAIGILLALVALLFFVNPLEFYRWVKAVHVIAVIAWMAGMLYLPRLFVYHAESVPGSEQSETFKLMERRLLRAIINPAMIVAWAFGIYLAWEGFRFAAGWLHLKIVLVVAMSAMHGYLARAVRLFAEDRNHRSARHWRIINEVPTVLMVAIVILVIVKPF